MVKGGAEQGLSRSVSRLMFVGRADWGGGGGGGGLERNSAWPAQVESAEGSHEGHKALTQREGKERAEGGEREREAGGRAGNRKW